MINYQSRFTVRCLRKADNCGFGRGSAGGCGERRSQHHSGEGRGDCCSRLSAGQRQQALLDEGLWVWGHLTQCWETSLQADRRRKE